MSKTDTALELLKSLGINIDHVLTEDIAKIQVHQNKVVGLHLVPGLHVQADELDEGIEAEIVIERGVKIEKPVHICFGVLPEEGLQKVKLHIRAEENSKAMILAHCTFPNARKVKHIMDAEIEISPYAHYAYFERHVHGPKGGVDVIPNAKIHVQEGAEFSTEFELIKGSAGNINFQYEVKADAKSKTEMTARISGTDEDRIHLQEIVHLLGEYSTGVIVSHIALKHNAIAEVENTLVAHAPFSRGHVDCKEIVVGNAQAKAVPVVLVKNPTAHVTHEAAIGSVDAKQLVTLMAHGLNEEEATDLIIEGLLSKKQNWQALVKDL